MSEPSTTSKPEHWVRLGIQSELDLTGVVDLDLARVERVKIILKNGKPDKIGFRYWGGEVLSFEREAAAPALELWEAYNNHRLQHKAEPFPQLTTGNIYLPDGASDDIRLSPKIR